MSPHLGWCRDMLPKVSRTFALSIRALPEPYEAWTTTGYLLCRVVDTVEDTPGMTWLERRALFAAFDLALLTGDPSEFMKLVGSFDDTDDGILAANFDRVLEPMADYPEPIQASMRRWIGEMSTGMALYSRRHGEGEERTTLLDGPDLDQYCWYVAGTVGHLLTDVFVHGSTTPKATAERLGSLARSFGLLLQMTNIVKDVTDDWQRNWCFVPESFCAEQGITSAQLLDPSHADAALAAVDAVNLRARGHYANAVAYIHALPPGTAALQRFCLFPMLLAGKTLDLALGNPNVLDPNTPVKVDRMIVAATTAMVEELLSNDGALGTHMGTSTLQADR